MIERTNLRFGLVSIAPYTDRGINVTLLVEFLPQIASTMKTTATCSVLTVFAVLLVSDLGHYGSQAFSIQRLSPQVIRSLTQVLSQHQPSRPRACPSHSSSLSLSSSSTTTESDNENNNNNDPAVSVASKSTLKGIVPNGAGAAAASLQIPEDKASPVSTPSTMSEYRAQAGPFAVRLKYGVLNPYGVWYGMVAILLGLPWFAALMTYQAFSILTRGKFDKQRSIPSTFNQIWGTLLMRLTRSYPQAEGLDILKDLYAKYVGLKL